MSTESPKRESPSVKWGRRNVVAALGIGIPSLILMSFACWLAYKQLHNTTTNSASTTSASALDHSSSSIGSGNANNTQAGNANTTQVGNGNTNEETTINVPPIPAQALAGLPLGSKYERDIFPDHIHEEYEAPPQAKQQYVLGNKALRNRQLPIAVQYYQKALHLSPKFAVARNNLAVALIDLGKYELAETQLKAALKSDPNSPTIWNNLEKAEIGQSICVTSNPIPIGANPFLSSFTVINQGLSACWNVSVTTNWIYTVNGLPMDEEVQALLTIMVATGPVCYQAKP